MEPEQAKSWLSIFDEQGFMKLLAVAGYLLPYAGYFFLYKFGIRVARYFTDQCHDLLKSIDEKLGENK